MKKFKFRLETLLKLRKQLRDERQSSFGEAQHAQSIVEERIGEIQGEIEQMRSGASKYASPGSVNVDRIVEYQRYELVLASQVASLEQQKATVAEEVDRRRLALMEANRDVKSLEKLRERQ